MSLAGPWPLKIVLDNVVGSHHLPAWLDGLVKHVAGGAGKMQIAAMAAHWFRAIAAISGIASYVDNYYTESVGQWVAHDLRLRDLSSLAASLAALLRRPPDRHHLEYPDHGHRHHPELRVIRHARNAGGPLHDHRNAGADVLAELRFCAGGHRRHAVPAAVRVPLQEGNQEGDQGGAQEPERNRHSGGTGPGIGARGEGVRYADTRGEAAPAR